jgi:hypothetical protein
LRLPRSSGGTSANTRFEKLIVELSGLGLRKACGAQARVVDDPGLDVLLEHTYGWQKRLVDRLNRKSRGTTALVAIEIADA